MSGVTFRARMPHERFHLGPLMQRIPDAGPGADVVVHASSDPPVPGARNVQVFHGLGDKGYTMNPIFLQRGRFPRARTAANMAAAALRLPGPFLRPPRRPGRRAARYDQLNAYGPRMADFLEDLLRDASVTRFGHGPLNERAPLRPSRRGPLLWFPTWDNIRYLGGRPQSSLAPFLDRLAAAGHPIKVKLHPRAAADPELAPLLARLRQEPFTLVPADADPYDLLAGARGVLTDVSSLGFEAYCAGIPVALLQRPGPSLGGLHAELEERAPCFGPEAAGLEDWLADPAHGGDAAWMRELLFAPSRQRNDEHAADITADA